jgi:hypothetical protein
MRVDIASVRKIARVNRIMPGPPTAEAQQQRLIPLTATKQKRLKRELKCQNHPNDVESKNQSVPTSSTEQKRRERVPKRNLDFAFTRNKNKAAGTHLLLRIFSNNITEIFSQRINKVYL